MLHVFPVSIVNLKMMTSQSGKRTIATQILPNISRSKNNHNMRNIFVEKSYSKGKGETSPRPFTKK